MAVNLSAPYQVVGITYSLPASADLSSSQWCAVDLDASGKLQVANAAGDRAVGILLDKPNAADVPGLVGAFGIYPCKAGAAFNEGDRLTVDGSGRVIATTSAGDWCIGVALGSATLANQIIPCLVGPMGAAV